MPPSAETPATVLDAWAIVAFFRDEPPAQRVEDALERGAVACWVNLGEALYIEARRGGIEKAREAVAALAATMRVDLIDAELALSAATIKVSGGLSYADCFAVATAEHHALPLMTGDPEILSLDRERLRLLDLNAAR